VTELPITLSVPDDVHEILAALAQQNGYRSTDLLLNTVLTDLARTHYDSDPELRTIVVERRASRAASGARHPANHLHIVP
jgi:hypothetical protein